jgi:5-methylcytosine-specific restriction endonuclease McrA
MPFMKNGKRDYKAELAWEHDKKPTRVKDRATRNAARSDLGLKVGDPRHADHKVPLTNGGSKSLSNLHAIMGSANVKKEALRKKKAAGKKG